MAFTVENMLSISTKKFKEWNLLKKGINNSGVISWSFNGEETSKVSYSIKLNDFEAYTELDYSVNSKPYKYRIYFESIISNLGKGKIWYFICPVSGKKCRKLYLCNGYFISRKLTGAIYDTQTKSKSWRRMEKAFGAYFDLDNYYIELHKKYLKTHYKGKPTKRLLKLQYLINKGKAITTDEIERAMVFGV